MNLPVDRASGAVELRPAEPSRGLQLGVCIVNYRSRALVGRLIENLASVGGSAELQLVCVDNSESDAEFQALSELRPRAAQLGIVLTVLQSPTNVGYAAGNNAAARQLVAAGVQTLLVINPDVGVRMGALDTLCRLVSAAPPSIYTVSTTHGTITYNGLSRLNRWTSVSARAGAGQLVGSVHSAAIIYPGGHFLAMTTDTWLRLGGLCEDFFLFGEEADLTVRALAAGIQISTTDLITVEHDGGATTGATAVVAHKSATTLRQASRSAVIFSRKYNGYRTTTVVLSRLLLAAAVFVRLGGSATRDVVGGIVSGLRAPLSANEPLQGAIRCSSR
jgi:N-acetylglucosaminyl-diphospho-decaprenol L-rhamnosyltransferase